MVIFHVYFHYVYSIHKIAFFYKIGRFLLGSLGVNQSPAVIYGLGLFHSEIQGKDWHGMV